MALPKVGTWLEAAAKVAAMEGCLVVGKQKTWVIRYQVKNIHTCIYMPAFGFIKHARWLACLLECTSSLTLYSFRHLLKISNKLFAQY